MSISQAQTNDLFNLDTPNFMTFIKNICGDRIVKFQVRFGSKGLIARTVKENKERFKEKLWCVSN